MLFTTPSSSKLLQGSGGKTEAETPTPFYKTFNQVSLRPQLGKQTSQAMIHTQNLSQLQSPS